MGFNVLFVAGNLSDLGVHFCWYVVIRLAKHAHFYCGYYTVREVQDALVS